MRKFVRSHVCRARSLLASTMLAAVAATIAWGAEAQQTEMDVAPIDVTARPRRPVARPQRLQRAARAPQALRNRSSRIARSQGTPPVAVAPAAAPGAASDRPRGPGAPGIGNGERADGPVDGFVATRSATGTKTDTPLVETPQSISVVTQDQIRAQGAQTINQALAYTAGVQTQPFGFDGRYDQFTIRGFPANQFGNYRDGLRQGNGLFAYFRNEPYDLERIEVFRGPASVLYGANAPGGLVNLVSKMPLPLAFRELGVDGGSYGRYQGRFDLNGPVGPDDTVLARITGIIRQSGTQVMKAPDDRIDVSPAVTVNIGPDTKITVLGNVAHNVNSMWPYYLRIPSLGVTGIRVGDPEFDRLEQTQWSLGYRFEHRFSNDVIFRQNVRFGRVDFDGPFVDAAGLAPNGFTLFRYAGRFTERLAAFNADNLLQTKFLTGPVDHTLITGLDYFGQSFNDRFQLGSAPSLDLRNPIYSLSPITGLRTTSHVFQTLDQTGLYAQDQMALGGLRVVLGGREDFVSTRNDNLLTTVRTTTDPANFSGRAGALYLFDNGVAPYASYSQSFLPTAGVSAPQRGSAPFVPTVGDQYEVGVKYQPPGWNSSITGSLFDIHQQNVLTSDPLYRGFSVQTGEIRSRGGEIEGVMSLAEGWNGIASYSFTDARVIRSNGVDLNKVPVGVPLQQYGVFIDYTVPYGPWAGLGGGIGIRHIGTTWADSINSFKNPSIDALDLALHYERENVRLAITARNATDQRVGICNQGNCTFSLGRVILASATVRW